jgi:molybdenum cofactor cytidylyltransferase
MTKSISALIMAAGASSRMGSPKALLKWKEKNLADVLYESISQAGIQDITLVTGKHHEEILNSVSFPKDLICYNPNWETGMGGSIRCGVQQLIQKNDNLKGILITLVDQPLINKSHIEELIKEFDDGNYKIVASRYESTVGPPAIFSHEYFNALLNLKGDNGAKSILKFVENDISYLDLGIFGKDADTPESYEQLRKNFEFKKLK